MKRLIFSQYTDRVNESGHSTNEYKALQFAKYKDNLELAQKEYAHKIGCDYELFSADNSNYDLLQFDKIFKIEEMLDHYDEVLYIDFDVIPNTDDNFFEVHDMSKICAHSFARTPYPIDKWLKYKMYDQQAVYIKACCKNAMAAVGHGGINDDKVINTGVIGMNRANRDLLAFSDELPEMDEIYQDATEFDILYNEDIRSTWIRNNETYFTYLINAKKVPFHDIGKPWNRLIDKYTPTVPSDAKFIHMINKEFEQVFTDHR